MEFSIGTQFSKEFSFEETLIVDSVRDQLNNCLAGKKYNSEIEKIYIGIICVSKAFEPFFMARPLKIIKKEPAIEYEIKLEFDTFYKGNVEERIKILTDEFLTQSKVILNDKKMKKFDTDSFFNDIKECLIENKFIKDEHLLFILFLYVLKLVY